MNNTIKVLIVEDDLAVAEYLEELLTGTRRQHFSCSRVQDLSSGLAAIKTGRFDAVLLDLGLPDSRGMDTALTVRMEHPAIPIVVLTGLDDEEIAVNALRMDIQDYLIKGQINGPLLVRSVLYAIERKRILDALRESEMKYRGLFNTMTEAFARCEIILDPLGRPYDYRYLDMNKAWERLSGIPVEKARGRTARELGIPPGENLISICGKVAVRGESAHFEQYSRRFGKWYQVYAYCPDKDHFAMFSYDITDRKRAEEALKKSEALLKETQQISKVGGWEYDVKNGAITWTDEVYRIYGVPKEFDPSSIPEDVHFYDEQSLPVIKEAFSRAVRYGEPYDLELKFTNAKGEHLWVRTMGRPVKSNGTIEKISGNIMDITDRKRIEEVRRESEERLRLAAQAASFGTYDINVATGEIFWSQELKALLGLPPDFASTIPLEKALRFAYPDDLDRIRQVLTASMDPASGGKFAEEHRIVRSDGAVRWVNMRGEAFFEGEGSRRRPVRIAGILMDITERKRAEELLRTSEEQFREVFAHAPVGMIITDALGRYLYVNQSYCRITGYSEQELTSPTFDYRRLIHPDDLEYNVQGMKNLQNGIITTFFQEKRYIRKDGSIVWVRLSASVRRQAGEQPQIVALVEDIDERKRAEAGLRESEERFRTLADNIPQLAWMADEKGWVFWYNRRWFDYTGASPEEMRGWGTKKIQHPDHADRVVKSFMSAFKKGAAWEDTFPLRRHDGEYRWFLCRAIPIRNEQGKVVRWFATNTDITERMRMEEEIKHIAQHDPLTGLPNRRLFNEIITVEMAQARRSGRRVAIFFLDLDRFKEINDALGHETGDALLKETATRLRSVIRTSDTVARIGGDEFNVLIPDISYPEYASEVAQKILNEIRKPLRIKGHELNVSTSIGISVFPDDSVDIETLLRYADIAMYYAKEHGRNMYQFYNPVINTRSLERVRFEDSLRRAIDHDEFLLYFQPLVEVETRKIVSAEVLLRWQHPEMGLLEPEHFFREAEEIGFLPRIDDWVLKSLAGRIASLMDEGILPVCVTVNVSAWQFQSPDLLKRIAGILEETGMPPECLNIEITETAATGNIENTVVRLDQLARMGVNASIDNFGTGYLSLNHLKRLPVRRLKIDKSFIRDIPTDSRDRAIISAVLSLAHSLKIKVVAIGVEADPQLSFLREAHCDEAQGFLFSEPLPIQKLRETVAGGR